MTPENLEATARRLLQLRPSRRNLFKAAAIGSLATLVALAEHGQRHKELPNGILSDEELAAARIRIHQTPHTRLYLKQSALAQFPLFQDAARGQLAEVVIVLVDSPNIDWEASQKFPQDARLVWQAPADAKRLISQLKSRFAEYDLPTSTPEEILDDLYGQRLGEMITKNTLLRLAPDFLKKHPEFSKKVYVFLAVGGNLKPNPADSYFDPNTLKDYELPESPYDHRFQFAAAAKYRGFILEHEIAHYNPNSNQDYSEYQADTITFNALTNAWQKYSQTGDSSGYAFVFVNDLGITYTARQTTSAVKV